MSENPSVRDVDEQLQGAISSFHRLRWAVVSAIGLLLFAGVAVLGVVAASQQGVIDRQQQEISSSCVFYGGLSGLAPEVVVPGKPPSKLGIQIVVGSRLAFAGDRCGKLPPIPPVVKRWALRYGLPAK